MRKGKLRELYKQKRQNLTEATVDEKSLAISNQLVKMPIWSQKFYHIFLPIKKQKEVNTELILPVLKGKDKNIVVSRTDFSTKRMVHFLLTDDMVFKTNSRGIPEPSDGLEVPPEKLDVVFVPLFTFDKQGHRVGFGGGFYDKFLNECSPETVKIGLSFFPPLDKIQEIHAGDIALDFAVTPEKVYSFS